ncbi:MAG: alpha/beta hydrolase [Acidobacteria bacterium]|nr:alpha/beta hydrolase [Acidobacteriota bacterium]
MAAALVLVFLTSWIVLPAPNRPLLALGVGAPELSAWLVFGGLVVCVLTLGAAGRDTLARATLVLAAVATVLASVPLVRLPFVVRRFDGTMRTALGEDFLHGVPSDRRVRMRRAPIAVLDLFLGIDVGEARVTRDVPFAAPDGVRLTLDIYRPVTAGRHPSVVQIYGGAWQRGAPGDDARFATYLAARGFVVFAIDYRHAPQWQWPAQIEDVRTSLGWIREHGGEYGADASRLALLGRSAGAQLAMVAAYEPGALLISAVVGWYGPVDLADGYRNPPRPDPLDVRSIEEAFLGGTPDLVPDRYREASPITYVSRRLPPSLLIYGSRDHVVLPRFGAMLDDRLRAAGATSVLLEIPWAEHAFDAIPNGPSGQLSLYYTEQFLAWALTRASPDRQP